MWVRNSDKVSIYILVCACFCVGLWAHMDTHLVNVDMYDFLIIVEFILYCASVYVVVCVCLCWGSFRPSNDSSFLLCPFYHHPSYLCGQTVSGAWVMAVEKYWPISSDNHPHHPVLMSLLLLLSSPSLPVLSIEVDYMELVQVLTVSITICTPTYMYSSASWVTISIWV